MNYSPPMTQKTRPTKRLGWLLIGVPVMFFIVLTLAGGVSYLTASVWKYRALPNTFVAGIPVRGKTQSEIVSSLRQATDTYLSNGIAFDIKGTTSTVSPTILPLDSSGTPIQLIVYSIDETALSAISTGKNTPITFLSKALFGIGERVDIPLRLAISPDWEDMVIQSLSPAFATPPQDARFVLASESPVKIDIAPAQEGVSVSADRILSETLLRASELSRAPISLSATSVRPAIISENLEPLLPTATSMIERPLTFSAQEREWVTTPRERFSWIKVRADNSIESTTYSITLDQDALAESIKPLKNALEIAPRDAQFTLKDGKVTSFVPSREGVAVDTVALIKRIEDEYLSGSSTRIEIPLTVAVPRVAATSGMTAGIEQLIGKGQTNFVGSPTNRVKNINRGAELLNGFLIQPGQEFSLLQALKPFTLEHGYFSELVIKGNRTTPEVGGGLCQIATTVFRATLDAGLTITKRQNHSYRVSYYEPPVGMDATIYDPAPDFAFINDTGSPILMAANIEKTALTVYLYGKSDGRKRIIGTPTVFDYVQPPPKKIIETLELKPGETRCTEKAHVGASASFDYTVTMPGGEVRTRTFKSKYRPWQEVCLVGVAQLSTPPTTTTSP